MNGIIVIGAGGHGKVVADILRCAGQTVQGFLDDDPALQGKAVLGLPVLGMIKDYPAFHPAALVMGIGRNDLRRRIVEHLRDESLWTAAIHPRAVVAESAVIGAGTVVAAGAVINPDARIGRHVIVNTGATVDHDCTVMDFAHLAPGSHLGGGVSVGSETLVGIGGLILPYQSVGEAVTVGAGSVVTRSIPPGVIAKGVPARWCAGTYTKDV